MHTNIFFRYIRIASHPEADYVTFPCTSDRLTLQTLNSHFPKATGLKYYAGNDWIAVVIVREEFQIPSHQQQFVIVTGTFGKLLNRECWLKIVIL